MDIKEVYFVDGIRTPFQKAGTGYKNLMSYQLGANAIQAVMQKNNIEEKDIEQVCLGTVIHQTQTSNVAREAALTGGITSFTPCHTVSQACISANAAIASMADVVRLGRADLTLAGGTDSVSDIPIQFPKDMRQKLFETRTFKSAADYTKFLLKLRPANFKPEIPDIAEFTTGTVMGVDCERSAALYNISREEQDEFAARSQQLAAKAWEEGHLTKEVTSVFYPGASDEVTFDNGIRKGTTFDKLQKLKPAFERKYGTLTAGNSSFLTDGAAVSILASKDGLKKYNLKPKAKIIDHVFTARNPGEELLLGPAYSIPKLLIKNGLSIDDIDVFEIHEAFAAQVLYNLKLLKSDEFGKKSLGLDKAFGEIPMDKLNLWGGSLSIGHPFGATGSRILNTAVNRLHFENKKYAVIAACAAGGHGHAMLIEKV
ncbi:thiolase family protein [Marinigracilibium pacificum]|uniref:acetyl-CoA C-acyltransferase n=1 Tax=Marinigracilibium pacificum TaxID=2729599 RepID=A0A848J0W4_9BACT|nr:thiolase family protein [Marinigracilibium pacificum]NMM48190.1 thiolase family protein [Marinigracilibium pacificum]